MPRSIIFAGCVRDSAPYLDNVLANCTRLAATAEKVLFIFAENDSGDGTKAMLEKWRGCHDNAHILCLDGLEARFAKRTQRLAFLRNCILEFIRERDFTNYDALCILDFDDVNMNEIALSGFTAATEFLFSRPQNAGVFAVSDPVYYDIYALRHEHWCQSDCWKAIRAAPASEKAQTFQALVCDRQVPIAADHAPISVTSAFGGLAIYRLSYALRGTYVGLDADGEEICEHVSFNTDIKRGGGDLFIFPQLRNFAPWIHCLNGRQHKTMRLANGSIEIELLAPHTHQLDHYLHSYPFYDRRLPLLLTVFNCLIGDVSVLDVGANILDTIALLRLSGVKLSHSISVDASLEFYKYAKFNAAKNAAYFPQNEMVWAFVGAPADCGNIAARNGTGNVAELRRHAHMRNLLEPPCVGFADLAPNGIDLVKTDLDGYDYVAILENLHWLKRWKPMLWAEAQIEEASDLHGWSNVLLALADDFPYVAAFDNFGFCLCAGAIVDKWNTVLELIEIAARYNAHEATAGKPRFYYLDLLFVPLSRAHVFQEFLTGLPELALRNGSKLKSEAALPCAMTPARQQDYHAKVG